jgi:hypothetical protein
VIDFLSNHEMSLLRMVAWSSSSPLVTDVPNGGRLDCGTIAVDIKYLHSVGVRPCSHEAIHAPIRIPKRGSSASFIVLIFCVG